MTNLDSLVDAELSLRSRLGHVALLLAAAIMTVVVGSLWLTEPRLPVRTQVAFGAMTVAGLSWVAFALWMLTHRRPLLAPHGIVAGRMAVTFTGAFVVGAVAVGYATGGAGPLAAAGAGIGMLAAACLMLARAHRRYARLTERRRELERQLSS